MRPPIPSFKPSRSALPVAKTISVSFAALLVLILGVGWLYQQFAEARDERRLPPPGKFVLVEGLRMHLHCQGRGSPTILVEQGIGAQALGWSLLNEKLSAITSVCAYDRAGMGYSDPVNRPTRSTEVAARLHKLLDAAGVTEDIVLVGWSAGGIYSREFYRQFPDRVKGMVLVDSSHEQQGVRMPPPSDDSINPMTAYQYLEPFGLIRLSGMVEREFAGSPSPPAIRDRLIAINLKSHYYRTLLDEGEGFELDLANASSPPSLGNLPLVVITEGKPNIPFMQEHLATWMSLHEELAQLSTNSRHLVAEHSAHAIHRTEPGVIQAAIEEVVLAARSGQTLESLAAAARVTGARQ